MAGIFRWLGFRDLRHYRLNFSPRESFFPRRDVGELGLCRSFRGTISLYGDRPAAHHESYGGCRVCRLALLGNIPRPGGFIGNFIFSLTDHAQNGFFYPSEWVPVASSAFAVGFLLVPFLVPVNRSFLAVCAIVMLVQAAVGLLGFYYHTTANLHGPSASQFDNFVYGAPAMAPLLFPDLVLLAFLGLWVLHQHVSANNAGQSDGASALPLQQTAP